MTRAWIVWLWVVPGACSGGLTREERMDPETCKTCHPMHFEEWSVSMHAYAAEDPVFLAMNARGQRETGGELGDFCIKCHAPVAVREGLTTDGLNIQELPRAVRGVTCWFCHQVTSVDGDHDAALTLADDDVFRAAISDPVSGSPHDAEYSALLDGADAQSAGLCGSCHDIVTPSGLHLERTYAEWRSTLFANPTSRERQTCSGCHMPGRDGLAAETVEGVYQRRVHDHSMPGVDVPLVSERTRALELVQRALDPVVLPKLCVEARPGGRWQAELSLENVAAGHGFPSGATQDRRAFVEVIGLLGGDRVFESGVVADDEALVESDEVWWFGERMLDAESNEVHMFWEARSLEGKMLPAPTTRNVLDPSYVETHIARTFELPGPVDEVRARVRIRPIDLEVLRDLVASGDLDESIPAQMPVFTLHASNLVWKASIGERCVPIE